MPAGARSMGYRKFQRASAPWDSIIMIPQDKHKHAHFFLLRFLYLDLESSAAVGLTQQRRKLTQQRREVPELRNLLVLLKDAFAEQTLAAGVPAGSAGRSAHGYHRVATSHHQHGYRATSHQPMCWTSMAATESPRNWDGYVTSSQTNN